MSIVFPFHSPPPPRSRNNKHGKQKKLTQVVDGKSSLTQIKNSTAFISTKEREISVCRSYLLCEYSIFSKQTDITSQKLIPCILS